MDLAAWFVLGLYVTAVVAAAIAAFWVFGIGYGLLRRPAVWFPFGLAAKMAAAGIAGSALLGFGGIIAAAAVFNHAFGLREDHRALTAWFAGAVIATLALAVTVLAAYGLAWSIFD